MLKGIAVSEGYAIAKILKVEDFKINVLPSYIKNPDKEITKYEQAIEKSITQLNELKTKYKDKFDDDMLSLFDAHVAMASDIEVVQKVKYLINKENYSLTYALQTVVDEFLNLFDMMDDEYLKSRAVDLKDVSSRIMKNALNLPITDFATINEPVILAIHELTPTQATQLDPKYIKGFICEVGGSTSHAAIVAKLLNIPAIFGIHDMFNRVKDDKVAILDGFKGELIISPSESDIKAYEEKITSYASIQEDLESFNDLKLKSKDDHVYQLLVNLGSLDDKKYVDDILVDGVGLFRTELLFIEHHKMPTFDEQFNFYKNILESFKDKPVTIRTLDIGGDKPLPYFKHETEINPALGNRGTRLMFEHQSIFRTQLKALLKASAYGDLKIMFPMIATLEEFNKAKALTDEVEAELKNEGVNIGKYQLGVMIEIPAAALIADDLAQVVDFFSIGTNDLVQYTLASDRINQKLAYLYQPLNPAILKLIKMTIDASKKHGITTSVCGEMASDPKSAEILLGLGVDALSCSPHACLEIKQAISNKTSSQLEDLAKHVLTLKSYDEIIDYLIK